MLNLKCLDKHKIWFQVQILELKSPESCEFSQASLLLTLDDVTVLAVYHVIDGLDLTERLADVGLLDASLIHQLLDIPHHVVILVDASLVLLVCLQLILKLPDILLKPCRYSVLIFKVEPSYLTEFVKVFSLVHST